MMGLELRVQPVRLPVKSFLAIVREALLRCT
jgi:hypothetical protein